MKKVKLKLTWDELNAIHLFLNDNIGKELPGLPPKWMWSWRMATAVMDKWNVKLASKLHFKKSKPFTFSIDIATASAFMLFFGWDGKGEVNFLINTVIKIQNEIDKQLCHYK